MPQLKVEKNKYFEQAKTRASKILTNKEKLEELMTASKNRLSELNIENSKLQKLSTNLRLFLKMIKAYTLGQYKEVPWKSMVAIVGGVLYFLMPLDLVPDFIPFTGFLDDFTIIMLIANAFQQDIERYEAWEHQQN